MLPRVCPVCNYRPLKIEDSAAVCPSCNTYRKPLSFLQKPFVWAAGRNALWRLPIFFWFVLLLFQNWRDNQFALNRFGNIFSAVDLGIHELGHILFSPFGEFITIAGGSLFQCIFPIMGFFGCLQKKWYFAATMCWCWLGMNLFDVATYAADARARLLPLTGGFAGLTEQGNDEAYDRAHDWYQLLSRTHHLNSDLAIAQGLRIAATLTFVIGFITGGLLLAQMIRSSLSAPTTSTGENPPDEIS